MVGPLVSPPVYEEVKCEPMAVRETAGLQHNSNNKEVGKCSYVEYTTECRDAIGSSDRNEVNDDMNLNDTNIYDEMKSADRPRSTSVSSSMTMDDGISEKPPSYRTALNKSGLLSMKPELNSPFTETRNRNWRKCVLEVNNTQLRITQCFLGGIISTSKTFSLQFAEVGLASDYEKKPHSFRLRVETRQLIFHCRSRKELLSWLVSLQMAISLALPLELRQLPEEIKRRRNRERERERRRLREQREAESGNRSGEHHRHRAYTYLNENNSGHILNESENYQIQRILWKQRHDSGKWQPTRRESHFSEKDFPHLTRNSPWEGTNILYQGQWAQVSHNVARADSRDITNQSWVPSNGFNLFTLHQTDQSIIKLDLNKIVRRDDC